MSINEDWKYNKKVKIKTASPKLWICYSTLLSTHLLGKKSFRYVSKLYSPSWTTFPTMRLLPWKQLMWTIFWWDIIRDQSVHWCWFYKKQFVDVKIPQSAVPTCSQSLLHRQNKSWWHPVTGFPTLFLPGMKSNLWRLWIRSTLSWKMCKARRPGGKFCC